MTQYNEAPDTSRKTTLPPLPSLQEPLRRPEPESPSATA
jgi:hypothetical protein